MTEKPNKINRRKFLKTVGAATVASVFASADAAAMAGKKAQEPEYAAMPRRKLGRTGIEVPVLTLGAEFVYVDNQILLRKALDYGVNSWDTAYMYAGGNSELAIGKFLSKNPDARKDLCIVTKAQGAKNLQDVEERCRDSLTKMKTDYIDVYYGYHMLQFPGQLTEGLQKWSLSAKERKMIKYFGFSTHANMAQCLMGASKLDWIDVIMLTYNFRLTQDAKMQNAIDACCKAGIGLIAMKTIALPTAGHPISVLETEEDKRLARPFLERGFNEAQAKIKIIMQDERFSSVCVGMNNVSLLQQNVAAALNKTKLSRENLESLKEYAQATCSGYCAGCGYICNSAAPQTPYVNDVMRYLMYYNSYGHKERARKLFAEIPAQVRSRLLKTDYSVAESRCPQRMPIGRLMAEAVRKLA